MSPCDWLASRLARTLDPSLAPPVACIGVDGRLLVGIHIEELEAVEFDVGVVDVGGEAAHQGVQW